jgi:hypothetical protein
VQGEVLTKGAVLPSGIAEVFRTLVYTLWQMKKDGKTYFNPRKTPKSIRKLRVKRLF